MCLIKITSEIVHHDKMVNILHYQLVLRFHEHNTNRYFISSVGLNATATIQVVTPYQSKTLTFNRKVWVKF